MKQSRLLFFTLVAVLFLTSGCLIGISQSEYAISGTIKDIDGNPMEGVTISFSGSKSAVATTDATGYWSAVAKGKVEVGPIHERFTFEPRSMPIAATKDDADFVGTPRHPDLPVNWKHLLLVYAELDVEVKKEDGTKYRFQATMPEDSKKAAVGAFENLPNLIYDASNGNVTASTKVIYLDHPLTSLSYYPDEEGNYIYRADPDCETVKADLAKYAPKGAYDSVHVLWNNGDDTEGVDQEYLLAYFGLGGYLLYDGTTTFDNMICYAPWVWHGIGEAYGEPWLHEWLHGVTHFLWRWGYSPDDFPHEDLHGHEHHGYRHSPPSGWMKWYSDYMQGRVWHEKKEEYVGITEEMWAIGSPTSQIGKK